MKKRMNEKELGVKVVGFREPLGLGGDTQTPRLTQGRFCRDQPPRGAAGTSPPRPGWVLLTRARLYKGWRNREGSMFKEGPWTHRGQSPASGQGHEPCHLSSPQLPSPRPAPRAKGMPRGPP